MMPEVSTHATHPAIITRAQRAEGHLRHVITMAHAAAPCTDIAPQRQPDGRAVSAAKRALIHHHIDHSIGQGAAHDLTGIKALTKLL